MAPTETELRNRVSRLARGKPQEALKLARSIEDPWLRCQALAQLAQTADEARRKNTLLKEAFAAALLVDGINRAVSVSAWPLKVLCKSEQTGKLRVETGRLLELNEREPSPVRRADALNLMLGAVLTGPPKLFLMVLERFRNACRTPLASGKRNKKGESLLAMWVPILDRLDPSLAEEVLQSIEGPVLRERAKKQRERLRHLDVEQLCSWPHMAREDIG